MKTLVEFWSNMFSWNYTASRKQYWIPTITYSLIFNLLFYSTGVVLVGPGYLDFSTPYLAVTLMGIALFIAQVSLTARRLHDTNRSAAWMLIGLIPIVGWIILVIMLCQPAKSYQNVEFANQENQAA